MREKMDKRMRILAALARGQQWEDALPRASFSVLCQLQEEGLIDGTGPVNDGGNRTNRQTRVWWITGKGIGLLKEREQIANLSEEEINRAAEIVQIQMHKYFGKEIEDKAELRESAEKLALGRREWREGVAARASGAPRLTGGIPEIVVTPAPAPTPGDKE